MVRRLDAPGAFFFFFGEEDDDMISLLWENGAGLREYLVGVPVDSFDAEEAELTAWWQ